MSQGTLFVEDKARAIASKALAKYLKLDVEVSDRSSTAFKNSFPLNRVPAFIGNKGYKLSESIAVNLHLIQLANPSHKLLGKNAGEYSQILQWMSFATSDLLPKIAFAFQSIQGTIPYNKKAVDEALKAVDQYSAIFEARLAEYTYLVGERVTIADVYAATLFLRGYDFLFGTAWRKVHPNTTRWFKTLIEGEILKPVIGEYKFRDAPIEFVPAKKEKKEAPKKAAEAPKKAAPAAEAPAAEAPKPKHPLALLPKPSTSIDEFKRIYSNEETREVAIPWFWKNMYNPQEWSLWKVDYKYNDELTLPFMSNNLVGGFFNRLSASTKYMFGCMVVYGVTNDNGITGFFIVQGQDHVPAFDVAPDWESYQFTKIDDSPENKEFIDNMMAWDKPVIVNGVEREIADGKVFK